MCAFILFQTFNKIFYFLRIWDDISFIATMTSLVISEIYPFLLIVVALMLAICKQYTSLHLGVDDDNDQFKFIGSRFFKLLLQMYESNKGEVNVPKLDAAMSHRVENQPGIHFVIFSLNISVWTFQQLIFVFFAATFGAKIIQAYEKHYKEMPKRMYKVKAQFNAESFDIINTFTTTKNFKVICFAFDKRIKFESFKVWNGFENAVQQQLMVIDYENDARKEEDQELLDARHKDLEHTKEMVDELSYRLSELTKKLGANADPHAQNEGGSFDPPYENYQA